MERFISMEVAGHWFGTVDDLLAAIQRGAVRLELRSEHLGLSPMTVSDIEIRSDNTE